MNSRTPPYSYTDFSSDFFVFRFERLIVHRGNEEKKKKEKEKRDNLRGGSEE